MKRFLPFLILLLTGSAWATSCTTGSATGNWQQLTLPSGMTTGSASIASIYAAKDCYLYVSMISNGTWRAKVSDLRTSPTTTSYWTQIDSGFPAATLNSGTAEVNSWTEDSSGNLYAGIGSVATGTTCSYCVVGKWNGSTWSFSTVPSGARTQLRSMAVDASNNVYIADLQADFYESTNGGSTFSLLISDAYTVFGLTSGWNYALSIQGGSIYWGGEGPYMKSPLTMATATVMYANAYSGNGQVIVGDGTPATAPSYLVAVSRVNPTGYSMSRYNVSTSTWTDENNATNGIPQYSAISNKALQHGTSSGEYLAGWRANYYRSTDGGVTWALYNTGMPTNEQASDKQVAVSPFDDSYYTSTDTATSGQHELWYYPRTSTSSTIGISIVTPGVLPSNFGWQVLTGATRRLHASVTVGGTQCTVGLGGNTCQVTWSITSDGSGGATKVDAASPFIPGAWTDLTAGPNGGTCTPSSCLSGPSTAPTITSPNQILLTATSVDDPTKSATVPIGVYAGTVQVYISPFNIRAYQGQKVDLQSWVWGAVNDNVVWSITQPGGGNGAFVSPPAGGSATTARDAVFSATVTGDYVVTATSVADGTKTATAIISVSGNALPSYAVTPNHTTPVDCSADTAGGNTAYDVGAGHTYPTIAAVFTAHPSWFSSPSWLYPAGTTIQIWNTDTTGLSPTHYHEYIRIDGQGTQAHPIRIVGCADSLGNLPVLDGVNATAYAATDNSVAASIAGLYQIGIHHTGTFAVYPTINAPSYIIIEGLAFRNAYPWVPTNSSTVNNYYNPGSSTATQWPTNGSTGGTTACIRPYEGNHLTVRGNDMEDCSFGILADFNGNNGWGGFFGDFDLEGNYFTNIGSTNQSEHMAYVQGFRQVIQNNYFDQLKSVSAAGELKMRGVAEVVRYNYFATSTNTRTADFVEEQDSNMYMSFLGYYYTASGGTSFHTEYPTDAYTPNLIVAGDEAWQKAYAYGNVFNQGPTTPSSQAPIHFFGDQSPYSDQNTNPPIRVGNLYDYSNSFYFAGGSTGGHPNFNFIDTMQNQDNQYRWQWPVLTIANNAIFAGTLSSAANQGFQWSTQRGDQYNFGKNWISSNWGNNTQTCTNSACWAVTGWPYYIETTAYMGTGAPLNINTFSNVIVGGTTAPFSLTTFVPTSGGGLVSAGSALPSSVTNMPVRFQIGGGTAYAITPRVYPLTLGAIDQAGTTPQAGTPTFSPVAGTYTGTQTVTISTTSGGVICYNTTGSPATNGTTGCTTGTLYTGPVTVSSSETLYAVAGGTGYLDSTVGTASYVIAPVAGTPTFSPSAGTYSSAQTVTISHSTGGVVCYNTTGSPATNGTTGCSAGTLYSGPITVSTSSTVYAVAGGTGYTDSAVGSAAYVISIAGPNAITIGASTTIGTVKIF